MDTAKYFINESSFLAKVKEWIESDGEVYVNVGYARSGGVSDELLIRAFDEFERILSTFQGRKGGIEVYRHPQFVLRGTANAELLAKALEIIPDGVDWFLFYAAPSHSSLSIGRGDNTHQELRQTFAQHGGREIALGLDRNFPPRERHEEQDYISAFTSN